MNFDDILFGVGGTILIITIWKVFADFYLTLVIRRIIKEEKTVEEDLK